MQSSSLYVQKLTAEGEPVWSFHLGDDLTAVWGVATAPDDAIWVAHGEATGLVLTKLAP